VPTLEAATGFRPFIGGPFQADVGNAPLGIAIMVLGFSDTTSGGLPLPFDLSVIGMPGCSLLAEIGETFFLFGAPPTVTWSVTIPLDTLFLGVFFYNQAAVADPGINAMNLTVTNGARARIGN
jgi:hypothetical protein